MQTPRSLLPALALSLIVLLAPRTASASPCPPALDGLSHYWPADGNAVDAAGNLYGPPGPGPAYETGVVGQAFRFRSLIDPPPRLSLRGEPLPPPWTLSAWVRRDNSTDASAALLTDLQTAIKLEQFGTDRRVGITQFGVADYAFDVTIPAGLWTHLALVARPTGTTLYVNGADRGTLPNVVNLPREFVGGAAGDRLNGTVDELMIFNRALGEAEVQQAMTQAGAPCAAAPRQDNITVPNVLDAFLRLTPNGEPLAFRPGAGAPIANGIVASDPFAEAGRTSHYQGIQRWHGPAGEFLFVSRAGYDVDAGNLVVVQMGSRSRTGERFRSNRLQQDSSVNDTLPPAEDGIVHNRYFAHRHVGSLQLVGDVLAVALEDPRPGSGLPMGRVSFFNVSNPAAPQQLGYTLDFTDHNVGVVGLTQLPDGYFLLVITWGDNQQLQFFRSNRKSFFEPGFAFELHDDFFPLETQGGNMPVGSDTEPAYQNLDLVRQSDGTVFMIGARNGSKGSPLLNGEDRVGLYEVRGWEPGQQIVIVKHTFEQHKFCSSNTDVGAPAVRPATKSLNASFSAAAGTYVSPSGELLLYSAEYWNDGVGRCVRFVEFHHRDVFRAGSPAFAPAPVVRPTSVIGEGANVVLDASASRGVEARPWIELFDDDDFAGSSVMMDYDDRLADDFQDFRKLSWNDKASSLRYYAPPGWSILLHDADNFGSGANEPVLALPGTGGVNAIANLSDDPWNFDNLGLHETRVTSVRFIAPPAALFTAPLQYEWSVDPRYLDRLTVADTNGASLKLTALDGPLVVPVRLTVRQSLNGAAAANSTVVLVSISNQPPAFGTIELIPGAIAGRLRASVRFNDPSALETHTLSIRWGDGETSQISGAPGLRQLTAEHTYQNDNPSQPAAETFPLEFTLAENGGVSVQAQRSYTVVWRNNTTPTLGRVTSRILPGAAGSFQLDVPFQDPDSADSHSLEVSWGDGASDVYALASGETPIFRVAHAFVPPASAACLEQSTFTLTLRLIDNGGATAATTYAQTVVWTGENRPGLALDFRGPQPAVQIPPNPHLNRFPLTAAGWFRTTQSSGFQVLFNHYADGFNGWSLYLQNGRLRAWYFRDTTSFVWDDQEHFESGPVADGRWHYAAFTVDETGGHLYVDGRRAAFQPWTGTPGPCTLPGGLQIGYFPGGNEAGSGDFFGQLDEFTLWDRALSPGELQLQAVRLPGGPTPGLIAYWPMNEGVGNVLLDVSGVAGMSGEIAGNVGWTNSTIWRNPTTFGPGYALEFDGNDGAVTLEDPALFNQFPITVSAWFKTCQSDYTALVNKYRASSLNGYQLFLVEGRLRAWYFRDSLSYVWDGGHGLDGGFVADGRWHHAALVIDATGGRLYVDGELRQERPWEGVLAEPGAPSNAEPLRLGFYPGGAPVANPFAGRLDNVTLWNYALTSDQVRSNRFLLQRPSTPGLLAYLNCDEAQGNVAKSIGTVHGSPAGILSGNVTWRLSDAPVGLPTVAPVVTIFSGPGQPAGQIVAHGLPGFQYWFQSSSNLVRWTTIGPGVEIEPGRFVAPVTTDPERAREFFRLSTP